MLVSIVTVYFNREDKVINSIRSLLNQTYQNIEVIAIDDGSTDDTLKVLNSIKDPRLKVFHHKNKGFTKSIISALNLAKGDIIAIHGSGDISHINRIEKQLNLLLKNDDVGVVGCFVEKINRTTSEKEIYKPKLPNNQSDLLKFLKVNNPFTHGEVMFKKVIYSRIGGYREFFKYAQDRDLWLRMSLETKFAIVPEILYTRFNLQDGVSASPDKVILQKYFNEVTRQCIELKLKNKKDLIENHGIYAPFFMNRSKKLSNDLARRAAAYFVSDELNNAKEFIRLSRVEKKTVTNLILLIIIKISVKSLIIKKLSKSFFNIVKKLK
ncbi:glycosyltransferase [Evansella sp. AB-P1]|uniref:glycosyltransferase n=1 Tax=Evansella sp. AB-P1 TaxID=3037653 RepID=UPI0024200B31|nr:glycosyltransferase [Evansella sp. AB-P1]MDG5789305.1 glycosyltransferase [Evansella sp. AB-P1]